MGIEALLKTVENPLSTVFTTKGIYEACEIVLQHTPTSMLGEHPMPDAKANTLVSPELAAETELFKKAYSDYRAAADPMPFALKLTPYPDLALKFEKGLRLVMIDSMLVEHPQQIANDLNAVVRHYHQLEAWTKVLPNYDESERLAIVSEFLEPLASFLLNAPHLLAQRFVYSVSHLAHQANLLTRAGAKEDDLPDERNIGLKVMRKVAAGWPTFAPFAAALLLLDDESFSDQTDNFRNKQHHRIPARFELGHTQWVTRNRAEKRVSYGIGGRPPLKLEELLVPLAVQHDRACAVFSVYLDLIHEISAAIEARNEKSGK